MPKFICRTQISDQGYSGDCDWLVMDLHPTHIEKLLGWMDEAEERNRQDDNFYSLEYFWSFACYSSYSISTVSEPWFNEIVGTRGFHPVPHNLSEVEPERIDCMTVIITHDSVQWACYPKEDHIVINSPCLSRSDLESFMSDYDCEEHVPDWATLKIEHNADPMYPEAFIDVKCLRCGVYGFVVAIKKEEKTIITWS